MADISPILEGPDAWVYQGPAMTGEHWTFLQSKATELNRPVAIINMTERPESRPPGHWRTGNAIVWFNMPDDDFWCLNERWVRGVGLVIMGLVQAGFIVYMHCVEGISRSSLADASFLMQYKRLRAGEAITLIQQQRPQAKPDRKFAPALAGLETQLELEGFYRSMPEQPA